MERPKTPSGLAKAGRAFWNDVVGKYELRIDEVRILENACRTLDEIDTLTAALRNAPVLVPGSKGQEVVNPLFGEVRAARALLARLVRQLDLPDEETGEARLTQVRRAAANVRWDAVRAAREA